MYNSVFCGEYIINDYLSYPFLPQNAAPPYQKKLGSPPTIVPKFTDIKGKVYPNQDKSSPYCNYIIRVEPST
jgi:hypothetical protein